MTPAAAADFIFMFIYNSKSSEHYNDVIMSAMASQITSLMIIYPTVNSKRRSKKKIKATRHLPLCAGNSPVTGEFPAQMASNAENVSIWWRHYEHCVCYLIAYK